MPGTCKTKVTQEPCQDAMYTTDEPHKQWIHHLTETYTNNRQTSLCRAIYAQ